MRDAVQVTNASSISSGPTRNGIAVTRRRALAGTASLALAPLAIALGAPVTAEAVAPPNIVYVVADDMGWADAGFHGSDISTPNIDKLASEGARLEQFYTLPMCTPTRAAFLTGRYPLRYGLQTGVIPSPGTYGIPLDEYLLPQILQDAGYSTALVGKWHLGHAKPEYWPLQRGFDQFYGALVGEIDHFQHSSHGVKDWYLDNAKHEETGFDNSLFGDRAARVIETHDAAKPLFLYLAFTAPHTPFQAPPEYLDRYQNIEDENRRAYAAMISVLDDGVGKVVAALERRGIRDNTIIVFHSDNGGVRNSLFAGDSEIAGGLPASNGAYRDGKGTLYEGGTRVVAFANWPGRIRSGVVDTPIHVVDMLPTLAGLAGVSLTRTKPLDGMDVWPAIREGKPSPRSEVVYNVDPMAGAVRRGDWKLVWKASLPQSVELFDLSKDASEATNLAAENPEKVRELQDRITELASEMAPPLLLMEAVRLTFYAPPVTPDPSTLFSLGD